MILLFDKKQKILHDAYAAIFKFKERPKIIANAIEENKEEVVQVEARKQEDV